MGTTRYTDGTTTIDLGGAVEAYVRRLATATHSGALVVLEAEAEAVRAKAEADWYSDAGVTKRTGKSGTVAVVTTVGASEIRVAIGSVDLAKAKFVRRPGPLSEIRVPATKEEWWDGLDADDRARLRAMKGPHKRKGLPYNFTKAAPNPKASDGKYLLQEFVGKPARKILKRVSALLPTEISAQMRNGRSG